MQCCPRCHAARYRYSFRYRPRAFILVECEACGYTGKEIPMSHDKDTVAATKAADAWNATARKVAAKPSRRPTLH